MRRETQATGLACKLLIKEQMLVVFTGQSSIGDK
jgi:hypothetical protein